jgi:hypothetical protein
MSWTNRPADLDKPGHGIKSCEMEELLDQVDALTGAGYTDWSTTFNVSAVTTPPTKGSSVYNAAYRRPAGSDVVDFEFYILIDATWAGAPGSGVYRFAMPFNASAGSLLRSVGTGHIFDNGTANRTGVLLVENVAGTHYLNWYLNASAAAITHTGSGTAWATGDIIRGSIRYEVA